MSSTSCDIALLPTVLYYIFRNCLLFLTIKRMFSTKLDALVCLEMFWLVVYFTKRAFIVLSKLYTSYTIPYGIALQ